MKIIHTADWHLGKLVHGVYMTNDQSYVLEQFIELVAKEEPDAVIISGDLYDRSVPPTEAVTLLDSVLYKINVELATPIFAIAGNHDSAERLSFGSSWYKKSNLHINGRIENCFTPIHLKGVHIYLVPYLEPGIVREYFEDSSIQTHHDAMKRIVGQIEETMDIEATNILVGHAFVTGGETSDSERVLSVGGSGMVSGDCFSPFQYTALGHLHNPNAIKHDYVRYAGSLLKYSFSESNHTKSVSVLEFESNQLKNIRKVHLAPKLDMREITGYLEEIMSSSFIQAQKVDDYLKVTLLDEGALIDPMNQLRKAYPNILHLERKVDQLQITNSTYSASFHNGERKSELDLFADFYKEVTQGEFSEDKKELMKNMIDAVLKEELLV